MKDKIMNIIEKHTPETTYVDGANATDEILEIVKKASINFGNFIGERPLPEYSKSTNKWRWWNNKKRTYNYATTEELFDEWGETIKL